MSQAAITEGLEQYGALEALETRILRLAEVRSTLEGFYAAVPIGAFTALDEEISALLSVWCLRNHKFHEHLEDTYSPD
jgi:hypothetical protein